MPVTPLPVAGALAEADLSLPRTKQRSLGISVAFRLFAIVRRFVPARLFLKFLLSTASTSWRLAFELSTEVFGNAFQAQSRGTSEELLARYLPAGGSLLDVGCGEGRWARLAARRAREVVAIDATPSVLEEARRQSRDYPNIHFVAGMLGEAPLEGEFDVALLMHVLEHVDDVDDFLRLASARARHLVIEVPNFEADPLNVARLTLGTPFHSDADHVREYTVPLLREHLRRNQLEVVELAERAWTIVAVARRR